MNRSLPVLLLAALGALGCAPQMEEQSKLASLRVLGVRKDKPYAKPGDTVTLTMLYEDASFANADAAPAKPRDVGVFWISACDNPAGDIYLGCLPKLAETFATISTPAPGVDPCVRDDGRRVCGVGLQHTFRLSDDIIRKHAPSVDRSPPYGLEYVFFLICAGELKPAPSDQQFPLACYSKSGTQLGADDFVVGYTAVYAYDEITNANPKVIGFSVDGKTVTPECIDEACVVTGAPPIGPMLDAGNADAALADAGDAGRDASPESGAPALDGAVSDGGGREVDPCEDPDGPACFEVCTAEKQLDCPEHDVKLETPQCREIPLNESNCPVDKDGVTKAREGRDLFEQAWINYYVDQGQLVNELKLLGDATSGYHEDHGTKIRVPKKLGPFHVWGVAHDSRGGTGWAKVRLATRRAK
jgi:hypothetical protein